MFLFHLFPIFFKAFRGKPDDSTAAVTEVHPRRHHSATWKEGIITLTLNLKEDTIPPLSFINKQKVEFSFGFRWAALALFRILLFSLLKLIIHNLKITFFYFYFRLVLFCFQLVIT